MAARRRAAIRPLDAALVRLQTMAARGVQPTRMAREVEIIVGEWLGEADADPADVKTRLDELHEQLASGVVDAEEQVSYVDPDEAAAVKQAGVTLAALVATRDAVERARNAL
ncbi:hypothetical protein GXW78_27025 [Roseomonas terrae]|uniref:Uncharacterized protein n=1 Tax=Neoroseomonas terrae TaxID=424799 RepID=A0ABS5EQN5_9PROT|nr:hypothetical protein [Neoroseomonas terrae]MBR0653334.1 hypothetical protein [Neoroseomonas terrae]